MNRRAVFWVIAAIVGVWLGRHFWPEDTEEDRVRAVVRAVVDGAEAGDVGDVMALVSPRFQGTVPGGSFEAVELRQLLTSQFLRRGPIHVFVGDVAVEVQGEKAHATFEAILVEGPASLGDVLPADADHWSFDVRFAREGEAWRIVRADAASRSGAAP